jgi:protein TonB
MKRVLEFWAFVAIAIGLHVAVGFSAPERGGDAGGSAGESFVTLQGSDAQVQMLIANWTAPPEHQAQLSDALVAPQAGSDMPMRPKMQMDTNPRAAATVAALRPAQTPTQPWLDTQTATPRPKPEPKPAPRPKTKQPPEKVTQPDTKPAPTPKPETKPVASPPQPSQAPTPNQRAAGNGGSPQSGTTGKTKAVGKGDDPSQIAQWGAKIRTQIERRKRPPRGVRGTGITHVLIQVAPTGQLLSAKVLKSSGLDVFDEAALAAVTRAGKFTRAPKTLNKSSYSFRFSIRFKR